MRVKELIEALKDMPSDAYVYAICDHGQTPEKVCLPSTCFVEEAEHTLWDGYHLGDNEINEKSGYTKIVIL